MALSDLMSGPRSAEKAPFAFEVQGGGPTFFVHRFRIDEPLSDLFEGTIDLVCDDGALDLTTVVGKLGRLRAAHSVGTRYWSGLCARAWLLERHSRVTRYRVQLVPQLWLLSRRRDSRIFQQMSTPQILEEVFAAADVSGSGLDVRLSGDYQPRDYCAQYRESDLHFAMRLMEEEGISFFFKQTEEGHTLVLTDDVAGFDPLPEGEAVRYRASPGAAAGAQLVSEASLSRAITTGRATLRDFAFKEPSTDLSQQIDAEDDGGGVRTDLEFYDYPGDYVAAGLGKTLAGVRADELQLDRQVLDGRSDVRPFCAGYTMELLDHPSERISGRFLLTSVTHEGSQAVSHEPRLPQGAPEYKNRFSARPADVPYRPPRKTPRPQVAGLQTATVVGPSGEEIYTDEFGRIKVQFHWDRKGARDEQSSCWVRVSQGWGGAGWGMIAIPRIGQEVIVQFLEGDPDRPIVTGRVYNAEQTVPYGLPDGATRSTWKSNSTPGGGGSNEIRFEDKAGSEEVYLHGQKDWTIAIENDKNQTIGNNETASVGNDRTRSVGNNETVDITSNETRTVGVDRTTTIKSNDTLDVGANLAITVAANQTMDVTGDQTETVAGAKTQTITGNRTETVCADVSETVSGNVTESVGGNVTQTVGGNITQSVGGNVTETVAAMQTTSIGAVHMENVGAAKMLNIGAAYVEDVGAAKMVNIGAVHNVNVGGAEIVNVGASRSVTVGASQSTKAAASYSVDAGASISLKAGSKVVIDCGSATVTIESGGKITVKGSDLTLKGSGKINLDASGDVILKSGGKVTVKGSGAIAVKGSKVGLN